MVSEEHWTEQAVCRSVDAETFFPTDSNLVHHAKRVCRGCPVIDYCRIQGIGERAGVFGGIGAKERDAMRRSMGITLPKDNMVNEFIAIADRAWVRRDPGGVLSEALDQGRSWKWINNAA